MTPPDLPPPETSDASLKHLLRTYYPPLPPADPGLENRIMAAIAQEVGMPFQSKPAKWRQTWVLISSLAAAGILATWGTYRWMVAPPTVLTASELVELETFLTDTWPSTPAHPWRANPDSEWF